MRKPGAVSGSAPKAQRAAQNAAARSEAPRTCVRGFGSHNHCRASAGRLSASLPLTAPRSGTRDRHSAKRAAHNAPLSTALEPTTRGAHIEAASHLAE